MSQLVVDNVSIAFTRPDGQRTRVLEDVSFEVGQGSFTTLVGPSGCGKSTLLQVMAGLLPASTGAVSIDGTPFCSPPRDVLYLFQQYTRSLLPWLSVRDNIAFGLRHQSQLDKAEIDRRCAEFVELVGLSGFEDYFPRQLSGGMQQRVAIARALVCHPRFLLMDEPFSSVDALTRSGLQDQMLRLWRELGLTIVFVTHDIEEAIYLGQRVIALGGRPAQVIRDISIDLPTTRTQLETREHPGYLRYRHDLLSAIFEYSNYRPVGITREAFAS
jgi:NitT/TauT family transport system ATP-binding protein